MKLRSSDLGRNKGNNKMQDKITIEIDGTKQEIPVNTGVDGGYYFTLNGQIIEINSERG